MGIRPEDLGDAAFVREAPLGAAARERSRRLHVSKHSVERPRHLAEIQRVDDMFDCSGAERPDELVLEVCTAHVETELFHLDASEIEAEAGSLETALEVVLLSGVAEACQLEAVALGAEPIQEVSDCLGATDRHHGDAFSVEIPTSPLSERFDRDLVADSFDKYDRTRVRRIEMAVGGEHQPNKSTKGRLPKDAREDLCTDVPAARLKFRELGLRSRTEPACKVQTF